MAGDGRILNAPVVDEALIRRLLARHFPHWAPSPISEVKPGGWDNLTFRIGDDLLVRLPRAACYAAAVATEQQWLPVLSRHLPLAVPELVSKGPADDLYPWPWSIYRWIDARPVSQPTCGHAHALAAFLAALRAVNAGDGPPPGMRNFWRGGPLVAYDAETREAIARLGTRIDGQAAQRVWNEALQSSWTAAPVWVHGDISPGNLLERDGKLAAVIDFGQVAVGDPACDLAIAWTWFGSDSRAAFRAAVALDAATWSRARGWALWKALIIAAGLTRSNAIEWSHPLQLVEDLLASPP